MNKGTQIFLLIVLFAASVAGGYFLEEVVMGEGSSKSRKTVVVEPEVVLSPIPDSLTWTAPKKAKSGKYSFTASAFVEADAILMYHLYEDKECKRAYASNYDGEFSEIPGTASQTYYLVVQNYDTGDLSEVKPITGFVKEAQYDKIPLAELQSIINSGSWANAPDNYLKGGRIHPTKFSLKTFGLDPVKDVRTPTALSDVCTKIRTKVWASAKLANPVYNGQGQLTSIEVYVTYPN